MKLNEWLSSQEKGTKAAVKQESAALSLEENSLQQELYHKLINLRNELAAEADLAPYMIATNRSLQEISRCRPGSLVMLKEIEEWQQARVDKFGKRFLSLVRDFCDDHDLRTDMFETSHNSSPATSVKSAITPVSLELFTFIQI